ncbi:MAG: efflux RND transporter periplasmic adaptor subunit, partial [Anaerolineales bacterium]|nr:efflux RND transporter periplasmic adaptor subunit [Anaerolineales bacterium]
EANVAAAEARVAAAVGSRDATLTIGTDAAVRAAEADLASATANRQAVADRYDEILNNCATQPDGSVVCPEYGPVEERTRAELEAARASEAAAQALLNQLRAGPTAAQRAAANGIVTVASANLAVAEAQLALVEAGPTAAAVSRVEVELAQAEARVAQAAAGAQAAEAAVSQAEAELAAAQVAVDRAQLALDTTMLTAPFAGVVSVIDVNPGELVALGNPILTLADLRTWQIRAPEVVDLDVARLAVGRPLEITLDALPGETLAGTVSAIALTPRLADGNTVYEVLIALDDVPDLPLRWGMTAVIRVTAPEG